MAGQLDKPNQHQLKPGGSPREPMASCRARKAAPAYNELFSGLVPTSVEGLLQLPPGAGAMLLR